MVFLQTIAIDVQKFIEVDKNIATRESIEPQIPPDVGVTITENGPWIKFNKRANGIGVVETFLVGRLIKSYLLDRRHTASQCLYQLVFIDRGDYGRAVLVNTYSYRIRANYLRNFG